MRKSSGTSSPGRTRLPLEALRTGEFVSGDALGRAMGISRAALWKRINELRARGYRIEARRGLGYRLIEAPDLSAEEVAARLKGPRRKVLCFDVLPSTNDHAMELAAGGAASGTVVVADSQSRGKGRLGRKWASPPGVNLYMSVVLRPGLPPVDAPLLTLASALASARAVREMSGVEARIKWPNDLVVSRPGGLRKLGGMLLEMRSEADGIVYCVVGVGVNVRAKGRDFPADVRPLATSIALEGGRTPTRAELAAAIVAGLEAELDRLREKGRGPLLSEWRELSTTLGRKVRASVGRETITGLARDIDEHGSLVVDTGKGLRSISSGDVTLLR